MIAAPVRQISPQFGCPLFLVDAIIFFLRTSPLFCRLIESFFHSLLWSEKLDQAVFPQLHVCSMMSFASG